VHPELGHVGGFREFFEAAKPSEMESRLDFFAIQSAGPPLLKQHPQCSGAGRTARCAIGKPPKKYDDICQSLLFVGGCHWDAVERVLRDVCVLVEKGVKIFRVRQPPHQTYQFWEWADPEVSAPPSRVILSSPKPLPAQTDEGASTSLSSRNPTPFCLRTQKWDLEQYLTELPAYPDGLLIARCLRQYSGYPALHLQASSPWIFKIPRRAPLCRYAVSQLRHLTTAFEFWNPIPIGRPGEDISIPNIRDQGAD